jgi:tetratricopeptide (TPR) repeat protein
MGEERSPERQYFFLYSTCLLIMLLISSGCAVCLDVQTRLQGRDYLDQAGQILNKGDYEGALKAYQVVLETFPDSSPGDQALLHIGMIWAHPENPEKDYDKALAYFYQLLNHFPDTGLRAEAEAWKGTLKQIISHEDRLEGLEKKVNDFKQQLDTLKEIDIRTEEKKREMTPEKQESKSK